MAAPGGREDGRDLARLERRDQLGHPRAQGGAFAGRHEARQNQVTIALEPPSLAGCDHWPFPSV
jgi:hypothetical protein